MFDNLFKRNILLIFEATHSSLAEIELDLFLFVFIISCHWWLNSVSVALTFHLLRSKQDHLRCWALNMTNFSYLQDGIWKFIFLFKMTHYDRKQAFAVIFVWRGSSLEGDWCLVRTYLLCFLSAFLISAPALGFCIKVAFIILKEDKPAVSCYPVL